MKTTNIKVVIPLQMKGFYNKDDWFPRISRQVVIPLQMKGFYNMYDSQGETLFSKVVIPLQMKGFYNIFLFNALQQH